ncbi:MULTISPECIES: hypothetical protein [unclassified Rhizobium]
MELQIRSLDRDRRAVMFAKIAGGVTDAFNVPGLRIVTRVAKGIV